MPVLTAQPAEAQSEIWSATLTVDEDDGFFGCDVVATQDNCSVALTDDDFEYNGKTYTVRNILSGSSKFTVTLRVSDGLPAGSALAGLVLHVGAAQLPVGTFSEGDGNRHPWAALDPQWTDNQQVTLRLAEAQSAGVLVSNIGQTTTWNVALGAQSNPRAQQFTTGTSWGYTLESIDIEFHTAVGTPANLRAELWSATSGVNIDPDAKLASLTVPSAVGTGAVTFAAPANTTLLGRTKYYVVVYRTGATTGELAHATSDAEDAGAAAGWSIGDGSQRIPPGLSAWSAQGSTSMQIRVNGAPVPSLGRQGSMSVDGLCCPLGPGRMQIAEGASLTYGIVIHQPPTADLTITPRHHNVRPDGSDYPEVDNSRLTIHNSVTWKAAPHPNYMSGDWQRSKSVRLTAVDDSVCKSPPGTRYWIRHHGVGGGPDWGGWDLQDRHHGLVISVEIVDDDCRFLAPSPGSVWLGEGASATYTVRLKTPLEHAAYISPRVSAAGDSDIDAITVSPGRIRVEAGDTSPLTFTVSAGRDADSRAEVLHVDHSVDSPEVPADYLGARVTVVVMDEQNAQNAARQRERDPLAVTGLALRAGSAAVALSPAFTPGVTSYRAQVLAGTTSVALAPHWSGGQSVHAGSRQGATTFTRPARVRPSGTTVDLALAPDGGATELYVMVSGSSGMTTYSIEVTEARPEPKPVTVPDDGTPEQQQPQPQQQTAAPLETPGPVVGLQLTAKGNKVIVAWEAPASSGAPDRYIAHIKNTDTGKGKNRKIAAGKTTTTFGNLTPGITYRVWVRAQNDTGKGQRTHARITLPDSAVQGG